MQKAFLGQRLVCTREEIAKRKKLYCVGVSLFQPQANGFVFFPV